MLTASVIIIIGIFLSAVFSGGASADPSFYTAAFYRLQESALFQKAGETLAGIAENPPGAESIPAEPVVSSPYDRYPPLSQLNPAASEDRSQWIQMPGYTMPYYIRINVLCNVVNVYAHAGESYYKPYTAFLTSTGTYTLHEGTFALSDKYEWRELFGGEYGHYACRIYSGLLFHSCPCFQPDVNAVDLQAYRDLGTPASLGCMRLRDIDARWIYENAASGTYVTFYDSEYPGPFGKPSVEPLPEGAVKDPSA